MSFNKVITDKKRRKLAFQYEHKRNEYKSIAYDRNLPNAIRAEAIAKLSKLPRNSSMTRSRNRCVVTARPRSVYRLFHVSRIILRELASQGRILGLKKSSW
jgi:ribosomal protein S14